MTLQPSCVVYPSAKSFVHPNGQARGITSARVEVKFVFACTCALREFETTTEARHTTVLSSCMSSKLVGC
eukprot:6491240-Amphidinium_carterae.1